MTDVMTGAPLIASGRVRGTKVFSADGEKVGKIEDVALDKRTGQVAFAVLGSGGFLGGDKDFRALPWADLTYDEERDGYVLPATRAEIEATPALDEAELSDFGVVNRTAFI